MRCKYDRIKYLIQIAYYMPLIFQQRGGERLNVAQTEVRVKICLHTMVIFPSVVKTAGVIFSHRDQHVIQHSRLTVHTVIHHMCHHVYSLPELLHTIDTRIDPSV